MKTKNKNREKIDNIINELILSNPSPILLAKRAEEGDEAIDIIGKKRSYDKKYREALKVSVKLDVQEFGQTQPKASAKDVLIAILTEYDPEIPSPILLELARVILVDWTAIQTAKCSTPSVVFA